MSDGGSEKVKEAADAPVEVNNSVRTEIRESSTQTAQTTADDQRRTELNVARLDGLTPAGSFDPNARGLWNNVRVAEGLTVGVNLDAPPTTDGKKPGADTTTLKKPDGTIDIPPNASPEARREAEKLNQRINSPESGLTEQQKRDMEQATEQLLLGKNRDGSDRKPPPDPAEVAKVLHQANRMFDEMGNIQANGFTKSDRNTVVSAMLHDTANPDKANQGFNQTCNVSTISKLDLQTVNGDSARLMVDAFASRQFDDKGNRVVELTPGGRKIAVDTESLRPDREAKYAEANQGSGMRDAYMRAMNHVLVNAHTQQFNEFYSDIGTPSQTDRGERRHVGGFNSGVDAKRPDGTIANEADMTPEDIQRLSDEMGRGYKVAADFQRFGINGSNPQGVVEVDSRDPSKSLDAAWQANGGKPMILAVDVSAAMFRNAGDTSVKGPSGHVVTIVDQRTNPDTGEKEYLMLDTGRGDKGNGWVSSSALTSAMNPFKGPDRSASVQPAESGHDYSGMPGDRRLVRPQNDGTDGGGQRQADPTLNTNRNNGGGGGVLDASQRQQEMERRSEREAQMREAERKRVEEEEAQRKAQYLKQKELEEEELRQKEAAKRRIRGGAQ